MKISIRGDKVTVTKSMKEYITEKLGKLDKYFESPKVTECKVLVKVKNQDLNLTNDLLVLQDSLKSGMKDIRENIHRLHDQSIDLKYEIENLGVKYKTLKIKVNYDIGSNLSYELKSDIIYIIKESLNNTIKHSDANISSIYLREHNNFFTLQIKDNGSDYLENSPSNGMGLLSIEEIAKKYRGVFNWKYSSGFLVHVTLMKGDLV